MTKPSIPMMLVFAIFAHGVMAVTPNANKAAPLNVNEDGVMRQQKAVRTPMIDHSAPTPDANKAAALNANVEQHALNANEDSMMREQKAVRNPTPDANKAAALNANEDSMMRQQKAVRSIAGASHLEVNPGGEVLEAKPSVEARTSNAEENKNMRSRELSHLQINAAGTMIEASAVQEESAEHNELGKRQSHQGAATALDAAKTIKINFQPADVTVPTGWLIDSGLKYGYTESKFWYGWKYGANARDRKIAGRSVLENTLVIPDRSAEHSDECWEIKLPDGSYEVEVFVQDTQPGHKNDYSGCTLENLPLSGLTIGETVEGESKKFDVQLKDGKLSLCGSWDDKLAQRCTSLNRIIIKPEEKEEEKKKDEPGWEHPFKAGARRSLSSMGVVMVLCYIAWAIFEYSE